MNGKTCGKCNKTCNMENVLYCPFCGEAYKYCSINLCECNENIIAFEKCTKCGVEPINFTRQEFDIYFNTLEKEYNRVKKCAEKLEKRIDCLWRKTSGRGNCMRCTRNTICDACYGPGGDDY